MSNTFLLNMWRKELKWCYLCHLLWFCKWICGMWSFSFPWVTLGTAAKHFHRATNLEPDPNTVALGAWVFPTTQIQEFPPVGWPLDVGREWTSHTTAKSSLKALGNHSSSSGPEILLNFHLCTWIKHKLPFSQWKWHIIYRQDNPNCIVFSKNNWYFKKILLFHFCCILPDFSHSFNQSHQESLVSLNNNHCPDWFHCIHTHLNRQKFTLKHPA